MNVGEIVLVDANVIIECHDRSCWSAITVGFRVQTVEKCVEETQNGHFSRDPQKRIDESALRTSLNAVHKVTNAQRAAVALLDNSSLDDGERDLWAHALSRDDVWILCGPDRASMRFGYNQGKRNNLVSLGELLSKLGHTPSGSLRAHFERRWLDDVINKLVLGIF